MADGELDDRIKRASDPAVPKFYSNGFASSLSQGDVLVVFERNGNPEVALNLSYTVAKTLSLALAQAIATLESATGKTMLTTHEIEASLAAQQKETH